ncbi:MAG TPA: ATP phosphoribosyltransferase regulatory subunit [Candidatus Dojkabacteria bacterium]|nr:ATP phosphoribosyltransferase regulatory subunit [Candidatus Dojkabacteria bacterium]
MESKILSKQPYKGTDDWYPKDMFLRNYLFNTWSKIAKRYGYEEYDTPIIEDANLYKVKSGEDLANNQLYSFVDKGGREIALRPEMTPSLARIIANKKNELTFPLRWFNIGRYYRYEKPQKGRKREFFQLNIDILGVPTIDAELEIIQFVMDVMKELKAPKDTYELRINNRYLLEYLFTNILDVDESIKPKLARAT